MRNSPAAHAQQSDPSHNRQFRRRWAEPPCRPSSKAAEPIRLIAVPNALDADGAPRAALLVPPAPDALNRRPALRFFASVTAAIAAKRVLEGSR